MLIGEKSGKLKISFPFHFQGIHFQLYCWYKVFDSFSYLIKFYFVKEDFKLRKVILTGKRWFLSKKKVNLVKRCFQKKWFWKRWFQLAPYSRNKLLCILKYKVVNCWGGSKTDIPAWFSDYPQKLIIEYFRLNIARLGTFPGIKTFLAPLVRRMLGKTSGKHILLKLCIVL